MLLQPRVAEVIRDRSRPSVLSVASLLLAVGFGMNAWIGSMPTYAVSVTVWTMGEILFAHAGARWLWIDCLVTGLASPWVS